MRNLVARFGAEVVGRVLVLAIAASSTLPAAVMGGELDGQFEGDGLRLELELDGEAYEGVLEFQGQSFPCRARRAPTGLVGSFDSQGVSYAFEARAEGTSLALTSGGVTYRLERLGGQNPLGGDGGANPLAGGTAGGGGAGAGFEGRFQGAIEGTPAVLTLQRRGAAVSGAIDAGGYPYQLQGSVSGGRLAGQLTDPQTGGGSGFEATLRGEDLELVLQSQDPYSGQARPVTMTFRRMATGARPSVGAGVGGATPTVPQGQRDPALVGVWRQSQSMSGGGASMVVESFLRISADGSFTLGGGRAVGGGAGWGGDTGSGGVEESGWWKTENRIVYTQSAGGGGWQPYARYYVEGGKLMFTFGDESRQIWYRVQ